MPNNDDDCVNGQWQWTSQECRLDHGKYEVEKSCYMKLKQFWSVNGLWKPNRRM